MKQRSNLLIAAGWVISLAIILFMLRDVSFDLERAPWVVRANAELGIPERAVLPIGVIGLVCTFAYALPQTSFLGAILLSGFLGGAVVTHLRVGGDVTSAIAENVLIGVLAWTGLWLRDARLRALLPIRSTLRPHARELKDARPALTSTQSRAASRSPTGTPDRG